jgi:ATP-dependent exoDNAse (exonuclease V) beta subunit
MIKTRQFDYPSSTRQTLDGKRVYNINGEALPSVTTILQATETEEKKKILEQWKKRVGAENADRIRDQAANRGSVLHRIVENYITDTKHLDLTDLGQEAHKMADILIQSAIDERLSEVWGVEPYLAYQGLFAGQTDLIGIHDGKITVCDHKNSNKPKKKEWLHDSYRIQLAAYALAFEDMFGEHIPRGVNFIITKDLYYQEFSWEGEEFKRAKYDWLKRVDQYYNQKAK